MRLLAVSHTGLVSGAERVLVRVLAAAVERGWEVVCACPEGPLTQRLEAVGVRSVVLSPLVLSAAPLPMAAAGLLARSARSAAVLRPMCAQADVVLVNGLLALPAVRLAAPAVPVVWLVHDVVRRPQWAAVVRVAGARVELALCVSEAAAGPVRRLGLRTVVVPQGTAWPVDPVREPTSPPVLGCAGLLTPWKGQLVLLDAVARLADRQVRVELVGATFPKDAGYAAQVAARAAQPDLAGRVTLVGPVEDLLDRMRGWTALVSASTDPETGPLVAFEAMSVGLPVVATAHGGPLEFVGDAGMLVPPGDAPALAGALEELLADPAARARMGAAGRSRVSGDLVLSRRLEQVLEVLAGVAAGGVAEPSAASEDARVRVGIVSYNTAALLDRCLTALPAALAGLRAEVVVVDNASRDGSAEVAERYDGVRVLRSPSNVGYARAMNLALRGAGPDAGDRAPVLLALNPDTVPEPGSLARLVEVLQATPEAGCVVPVLRNDDGSLQHSVHRFPSARLALAMGLVPPPLRRGRLGRRWWMEGFAPHDRREQVDWAIGAVHCLRSAALPGPGPYSERWFMYAEDMELCWRLRRNGWATILVPEAQVAHVGNAAGAVEFGADREARWLDATYDWYALARGEGAARRWAAANVVGLSAKLALLYGRGPAAERHRAVVSALRTYHRGRLRAATVAQA